MKSNTLLTDRQVPLISVIVPIYNREELIDKTVLSLIHQPCTDELEIVLVNDGSTDNSKAVCEK